MYMMLKKELLGKSGLYLVTDSYALKGKDILLTLSRSLKAGVDIVQFRDKEATDQEFLKTGKRIKNLLKERDILFIINDRVELALILNSDGVHLGQDDMSVEEARRILGNKKIVGLSTHTIHQMYEAAKKDVDYISIGPIFQTSTKPDCRAIGLEVVRKAREELKIPFVAIGGINETNIKDVVLAGARRVAVVSAIPSAKDPFIATRNLIEKMVL